MNKIYLVLYCLALFSLGGMCGSYIERATMRAQQADYETRLELLVEWEIEKARAYADSYEGRMAALKRDAITHYFGMAKKHGDKQIEPKPKYEYKHKSPWKGDKR